MLSTRDAWALSALVVALAISCNGATPQNNDGAASGGGAGGSGGTSGSGGGGMTACNSGLGGAAGATYAPAPWREPAQHRAAAVACRTDRQAGACTNTTTPACTADSQCGDGGVNGRCTAVKSYPYTCVCSYDACASDSECGEGPCDCRATDDVGNRCLQGNCKVDSDCGVGGYCSPTSSIQCGPSFGVVGYYCHTRCDQCMDDADCAAGSSCRFDPTGGRWTCKSNTPTCAG